MAIGNCLLVLNKAIFYLGSYFRPPLPLFCKPMTSIPQPLVYKKSSVQVGLRDSPIQELKIKE